MGPIAMLPPALAAMPFSVWEGAVAALQFTVISSSFASEASGSGNTPYSKFAQGRKLEREAPSRAVMERIYTPALLTSTGFAAFHALADGGNGRALLVACALVAHFGKRLLEVRCVHKYSGTADMAAGTFIGVYYALVCVVIAGFQALVPAGVYTAAPWSLPAGLALFATGQIGNGACHKALADMREGDDAKYVLPRGGIFEYAACPHYGFELVSWLGVAVLALQLNAFLVFCGMASYLGGRSVATSKWYRAKFKEEYPASRRNMVPFLF